MDMELTKTPVNQNSTYILLLHWWGHFYRHFLNIKVLGERRDEWKSLKENVGVFANSQQKRAESVHITLFIFALSEWHVYCFNCSVLVVTVNSWLLMYFPRLGGWGVVLLISTKELATEGLSSLYPLWWGLPSRLLYHLFAIYLFFIVRY